jgi:hypothetical protein
MSKDETDSNSAPKKAVRKRAVRRVVTRASTSTRQSRVTKSTSESAKVISSARKAPATVPRSEKGRLVSNKVIIISVLCLVVLGATAFIGNSDSGVIDVNSKIVEKTKVDAEAAAANNSNNNESGDGNIVVPVQNTPPVATILSGRGVGTPDVEQVPVVETEVATTTDESTEVSTEEGVSAEEVQAIDTEVEATTEEVPAE